MIGITTRGEYRNTINKLKHLITNQRDVATVLVMDMLLQPVDGLKDMILLLL